MGYLKENYRFGKANCKKKHGAISQLIRVLESVCAEICGVKRGKPNYVILALLDAAKAFDRMNRKVLLDNLWEKGIRGKLFEFICGFFFNRRQRVHVGQDGVSKEVEPTNGGPQGSLIIMFCWLVYIDDLPEGVHHAGLSLFMDDVALWISHPNPDEAIRLLNADLDAIYSWSVFSTVCFDALKYHLFDFGKLNFLQDLMDTVIFGGSHPQWSSHAKFLGATLDTKLDLLRCLKDSAEKAESAQWRVLNHARQRTGASPATLCIIFAAYVLSVMTYGSELWIFQLKKHFSHKGSVRSKYRANWDRLNDVYMKCARRILGAPKKACTDAILIRLGWMPLYHLLVYRALIWYVKGRKGLAGPALQGLIHDMQDRDSKHWKSSRFFKPASQILSHLAELDPDNPDFFSMDIPMLKTRLRNLMYVDLTDSWSKSSMAAVTHIIHPEWQPRKLAVSMHSRFSHVMYNCLAVNRAPFRTWLYKIKRSKSKLCRYGCNCQEDFSHVLFFCASVIDERKALKEC